MTDNIQSLEQAGNLQLEKVAAEFSQWRIQKKSSAEKIPLSLLQAAQKLSLYHKSSTVRQRLGLTKAQMDRLEDVDQPMVTPQKEEEFLTLVPHSTKTDASQALTVTITTPDGLTVTLSGITGQTPATLLDKLTGSK